MIKISSALVAIVMTTSNIPIIDNRKMYLILSSLYFEGGVEFKMGSRVQDGQLNSRYSVAKITEEERQKEIHDRDAQEAEETRLQNEKALRKAKEDGDKLKGLQDNNEIDRSENIIRSLTEEERQKEIHDRDAQEAEETRLQNEKALRKAKEDGDRIKALQRNDETETNALMEEEERQKNIRDQEAERTRLQNEEAHKKMVEEYEQARRRSEEEFNRLKSLEENKKADENRKIRENESSKTVKNKENNIIGVELFIEKHCTMLIPDDNVFDSLVQKPEDPQIVSPNRMSDEDRAKGQDYLHLLETKTDESRGLKAGSPLDLKYKCDLVGNVYVNVFHLYKNNE